MIKKQKEWAWGERKKCGIKQNALEWRRKEWWERKNNEVEKGKEEAWENTSEKECENEIKNTQIGEIDMWTREDKGESEWLKRASKFSMVCTSKEKYDLKEYKTGKR